jgi:hypothetical protein
VTASDCPSHWLFIDPKAALLGVLHRCHQFIRVSNDQDYLLPSQVTTRELTAFFMVIPLQDFGGQ